MDYLVDDVVAKKLEAFFAYLKAYLSDSELETLREALMRELATRPPRREEPALYFIGPKWTKDDIPQLRKLIINVAKSVIKDKNKIEIIKKMVFEFF